MEQQEAIAVTNDAGHQSDSKLGVERLVSQPFVLPLDSIVCGDNVVTMQGFPDASIDLVVTSPPYDNLRTYGGHSWDFEGVAQQLWRVIKPGGVVVWVVADATVNGSETGTSFRQALRFMEIGFRLHDTMIYLKPAMTSHQTTRYSQQFEFMFVLVKNEPSVTNLLRDKPNAYAGQSVHGTKRKSHNGTEPATEGKMIGEYGLRPNWWLIANPGTSGELHPATFPEALARDHILSWSNEGDIVLDPFAGSFTTCKMAMHNGRRSIGIEINPEYCEIGRKRLAQKVLF